MSGAVERAAAVNPWAGEVALMVDGVPRVMRLTLGALAELEAALGADSLLAVIRRFEAGEFRAADLMALLAAGLRGGGWRECSAGLLAEAEIAGGPVAAAEAAARLLARAFQLPDQAAGADGRAG